MPARPLLLWVTVLSPAHSYPGVTPNPPWASAAPRGSLWMQGVERVERGRGVAQAAVRELRCHRHLRVHPMAPAFALRPGTSGTQPLWGRRDRHCQGVLPGHEVLPYPRGWSPPWPAGTAEGWRGCAGAGVVALPPSCHPCLPSSGMWGWQLALGTELSHGPSSIPCSIPAARPRSSTTGSSSPSGIHPVWGPVFP